MIDLKIDLIDLIVVMFIAVCISVYFLAWIIEGIRTAFRRGKCKYCACSKIDHCSALVECENGSQWIDKKVRK